MQHKEMSVYEFLMSDYGKGTLGVVATCLIIIFPILGTWLIALITMGLSLHVLFRAIDRIGQTPGESDEEETAPAAIPAPPVSVPHAQAFDVNSALAEMEAEVSRMARSGR